MTSKRDDRRAFFMGIALLILGVIIFGVGGFLYGMNTGTVVLPIAFFAVGIALVIYHAVKSHVQ